MFIGHFGVALAAKRAVPKVSLGVLFAAVQLLDLLWPLMLLGGLEHVHIDPGNTAFTPLNFYDYPITHGLAGALVWSGLFALLFRKASDKKYGAWVLGALVFSHWVLDFVTHRRDLPLLNNDSMKIGLALWNNIPATVIIETLIFLGGAAVYMTSTKAVNAKGTFGFLGLIVLLLLIYVSNLLGPPPPGETAIAIVANLVWLFVLMAWWVDRNRNAATPGQSSAMSA